ncbi:Hypothetical Protein FCC1311_107542 [Hondaea fermentalgiana]|uniref:Right handed beta helix domain-containing protein n=1 Tax=Hondaea fermentalgiana TaxID=2315210 RepID=A0A2R5GUK5_9STRA|nr:Hypothetical Protein FCC1311_107542 [Hondaea fermentalgiana]|eukprot:GBG34530.1 Hypothetical Protein FCC1311_107542 [Hondaea fermentalgiana]
MRPKLRLIGAVLVLVLTLAATMGRRVGEAANVRGDAADKAPREFDCAIRKLAVEFALKIQPFRPKSFFQELVKELNTPGGLPDGEMQCPEAEVPKDAPASFQPRFEIPTKRRSYFVDANGGSDKDNDGSIEKPFATAAHALDVIRSVRMTASEDAMYGIVFRQGRHYFRDTLQLGPRDSHLTLQNYNGEEVWLSGAIAVPFGGKSNRTWQQHPTQANVWTLDVAGLGIREATGLRINGERAVRARYPNGCTSDAPLPSGYHCKGKQQGAAVVDPRDGFGSNLVGTWIEPEQPTKHQANWRQITVESPQREVGTAYHEYQIGVGGTCRDYDPPAGYWCGLGCWGGTRPPPRCLVRFPAGIEINSEMLPNGPYKSLDGAIVHAWHKDHWASWAFEVDAAKSNASHIMLGRGGFQDARGGNTGEAFFVENLREELDADNEFFWDAKTQQILYVSSAGAPSAPGTVEIPTVRTLVEATGDQANPVTDLHILGLGFRDTRLTYLDNHTMVSGGDWGLSTLAAVMLRGTRDTKVDSCVFENLDGNAIHVRGFARGLLIQNSDFHLLGGNAISLLGETEGETLPSAWGMGWNGTAGNQPRGSVLRNNVGYGCGLFMKQTSFLFHGKAMESLVQNNVFFRAPRAGINLNDGFGGANVFEGNLLFNTVKETGDHGPFNAWDRQPFAHSFDAATGRYVFSKKAADELRGNFMLGSYYSQEAVDTDDGSQGFNTHHNVFVYAENGLKTDFFGHSNSHHDNLYAYLRGKGAVAGQDVTQAGEQDQFLGNTVIMLRDDAYVEFPCGCKLEENTCTRLGNNRIFTPQGTTSAQACGMSMPDLVRLGYDSGTAYASWPAVSAVIDQARQLLGLDDGPSIELAIK